MNNRSKLLKLTVKNLGCIGPDGVEISLDEVICLVGRNNAGKSTILRAYELAHGSVSFQLGRDRCRWAPEGEPSIVEMDVHIPEGVGNVHPKWKSPQGDFLVVRSQWSWSPTGEKTRKTFDPDANQWAEGEVAGGADNVFNSRLPKPLRIGSLEDADKTHETLLTLALTPFVDEISAEQNDPQSKLSITVGELVNYVESLSESHQGRFSDISSRVHDGFNSIFPSLSVRLDIAMSAPTIKILELLKAGSSIRIQDGNADTTLTQQGTGARRALFWSMLRVHNELTRAQDAKTELAKKLKKAKTESERTAIKETLEALESGASVGQDDTDPAFPGYLLLIDEPENALHPMAARAAQRHLYKLAEDPEWQVMLTTHSPYFINPLADHTTIVRLSPEPGQDGKITRKTYRSDTIEFDVNTKRQLQAIQQMDAGFSEIFFGSYPIVTEGDTEFAAFVAAIVSQNHPLTNTASIIRARGKAILPAIIRMLRHFNVGFSIIHDVDWPFDKNGDKNGMWTINESIAAEISECRAQGMVVNHRCSLPDFERFLGGKALGKDKPVSAFMRIASDEALGERVQNLFVDLCDGQDRNPFGFEPGGTTVLNELIVGELERWNNENGGKEALRLYGKSA